MSKQIDEKTAAALADLGVSEEEIAELAEKNKAAPQEENVVEKEDATDTESEPTWLNKLAEKVSQVVLGRAQETQAPDASLPEEARKTEEVTPANDAEPVVVEEEKAADEPEAPMTEDMFKALGAALAEAMQSELEKRDEQIAALTEQVKAMTGSIEEKVEQRLADMPPAAHVAPSLVGATAIDAPETQKEKSYIGTLMGDITRRTDKLLGGKPDKMEV